MEKLQIEIFSRYAKNKHLRLNMNLCISEYFHTLTISEWIEYCMRKYVFMDSLEALKSCPANLEIEKVIYEMSGGLTYEYFRFRSNPYLHYETLLDCITNEILNSTFG